MSESTKATVKMFHENKRQYDRACLQVYQIIWESIADEGRHGIEMLPEYAAVTASRDPLELMKLVKKVHLTTPGPNKAVTKIQRLTYFTNFPQQPDEHVRDCSVRFKQTVAGLKYANLPEPSEDVQAAKFLQCLDQARYGELHRSLFNAALQDESQYPKTLDAAMAIAQQYLGSHSRAGTGGVASAYLTESQRSKKTIREARINKTLTHMIGI